MSNFKLLYKNLKKNKKAMLIRTAFMGLMLLSVNTFAWFVYLNKFDGNINANVVAWDVSFYDEDTLMSSVAININNLYPGMENYTKEITVNNNGDLKASLNYKVESFELFGTKYENEDLLQVLEDYFPFSLAFSKSSSEINSKENATFSVSVNWPFESTNEYTLINELVEYNSSFEYYNLVNDEYILDSTVNSENYISKLQNGLYVNSDDVDSYWGKKSAEYKKNHPNKPSLVLYMDLIVQQIRGD